MKLISTRDEIDQLPYSGLPQETEYMKRGGDSKKDLLLKDTLQKKQERNKEFQKVCLTMAKKGDPNAMATLGECYLYGHKGFAQDAKAAKKWFKKAHDAGDIEATAMLGRMILLGEGGYVVDESQSEQANGLMYISMAACQGSGWAAYVLGRALVDGKFGLEQDHEQGLRWLKKSLQTDQQQMPASTQREILQDIEALSSELSMSFSINNDSSHSLVSTSSGNFWDRYSFRKPKARKSL